MADRQRKKLICNSLNLASESANEQNGSSVVSLEKSEMISGRRQNLWKCSNGHSWETSGSQKILTRLCPFCSGKKAWKGYNDLSTTNPELVCEWDFEKNQTSIYEYRPMSNKKVWWKCDKGHSWDAVIAKRVRGEKCPICQGKQILIGFNDLATTHPILVQQWDYDKNLGFTPQEFSKGSVEQVWWKCNLNHSWKAAIYSRAAGTGCPTCAKELQSSFPEKAIYYYISKIFPDAISGFRAKHLESLELDIYIPSLSIAIEYDGERWHQNLKKDLYKNQKCAEQSITLIRVREPKCPPFPDNRSVNIFMTSKKSGISNAISQLIKEISRITKTDYTIDIDIKRDSTAILSLLEIPEKPNNLRSLCPDIAKEWDYDKNGTLLPDSVTTGSDKTAWWICPLGHSYSSSISSRVRGRGCSFCSGKRILKGFNDFESRCSELAQEWDYQKNDVTPDMVAYGSDKIFWWICSKGHSYKCSINNRRAGQMCHYCSGKQVLAGFNDISTTHPTIAQQWCHELNSIHPYEITAGSHKQVWWECKDCGHRWQSFVYNRCLNKAGCPKCRNRKK